MTASLGEFGETIASDYLSAKGYRVVSRNWHCRYGELDIIAYDDSTLVFVEVKTRKSSTFGSPEEAVTRSKQSHLLKAALLYIEELPDPDVEWRIDVVTIHMSNSNRVQNISILTNAILAQDET